MARARSVAVLDLYARADSYLGDSSLARLTAKLVAAGHVARLLRLVASGPTWRDELRRFLATEPFDVVVLPRAWDLPLVDEIRRMLAPDALLVRLTSGVAAPLDAHFDRVIDEPGLELLVGGGDPAPAAFHRTSARELRQHRGEAPPPTLPPVIIEGTPGRPTLSGPASGCPFLLDATRNPHFARLELDAERVQTRGCTFCLDNTGAYAAPSQAEVLAAWLGQLRAHKARDPNVRELLLTDERPHPHLPALFGAIAEEKLGPIELLWKSRVDWLLEFADGPLEEALVLAEASGSVLHLYLVGFESFDAFHLELFNKGVTVDDNRRAIDKLRQLGARHPRSFEYQRLRAHGIVLFTPWTTPQSLLENARVMREVRFHELRSEAIRTRLRLYPRTPLHALAQADGLLADRFDAGDDRAVEQGYDASVPWRFQDGRTRAILHIARRLSQKDRSQTDANVLEVATRFVLRWPGLADEPEVAVLPLERALANWNLRVETILDGAGAAAVGFDFEIEAVVAGEKRACLKEAVDRDEAAGLVRAYRAMGLAAEQVSMHGYAIASGSHRAGDGFAIVAVARDAATLEEVLALQRAHATGRAGAPVAAMGALMGYPPCCIAAFEEARDRGDNLENERAPFRRAPSDALDPRLNRLSGLRLLSHHLCRPACSASAALAESTLARLDAAAPGARAWVDAHLRRTVLFLDYERMAALSGRWDGHRFRVDAVDPFDWRDLDAFPLAAVELDADGVRLTGANGQVRVVASPSPLLVTPGEPLAAAALAALGPQRPVEEKRRPTTRAPALPPAFRVGVRVREYTLSEIRSGADAHELLLARGDHRLRVRLRAHAAGVAATIRRGRWALDIDDAETLPEPARDAVRVLVGALGG